MKRVFSFIIIAFVLIGCSSNKESDDTEEIDVNDINIEQSDNSSNGILPFDVDAFEKSYYKEYDSFQDEYEEKFEDRLNEDSNSEANLIIEEAKLLFKDGKMSEAVVFLSVLNDIVDGEDEIRDLATEFIEDLLNGGSHASKTISDGLEIKIGATDQDNISIGVYDANGQDEL